MTGRLKDLAFGRNGEQILTLAVHADFTEKFDELKNEDIDIEIKKHRKKRSLDANAYMWILCEKLALKVSEDRTLHTKEDVYRESIRQVGVFKNFSGLSPGDARTLRHAWEMLGTGWITEQVDYMPDGENVIVRCYYGSSTYNTKQMSRLIDNLIQDCKALGIETDTPEEVERIKSLWAQSLDKKGIAK